ncbi:dephospho-CoA kinase [Vibrio sp. 11986-1-5]|uniref:dephospho-CoA kinase n=1 Tax=Vibrio sp. 11986-1-5 TaxID=2211215 RepID=UPI000D73CDBF|nr:dephospho-CoA kinase [Vibrio sp. 11986-1-5]PXA71208.1 dephospho-CoA kinase [Vibrio sp. 11986-1-5]
MALIIGLTGGIASGKTTIANLFQEHFSIDIVDADIIARQVVDIGTPGLSAVIEHFGENILQDDGHLNRGALRERIFADPIEKQWLNATLHPLINQKMTEQLKQVKSPYGLLVVPLLIENQLQSMVDRVLVVDVDEQTQISRTMARDKVNEQQARAILAAQATRAERLAIADDVIKNEAKNQQLLPQITELHQKYLAMSGTNR